MTQNVLILDALVGSTGVHEMQNVVTVLQNEADHYVFKVIDIQNQIIHAEHIAAADKVIISGSPATVYKSCPWMQHLEYAFAHILRQQKPTLAICFGAQFLAQMLGASVSENPSGLEFGSVQVKLTQAGIADTCLHPININPWVHATHNDSIKTVPTGATLLAYNENSPIQAYQYQTVLATQFHPDIPLATMQGLLASRREQYFASGFIQNEAHLQAVHEALVLGQNGHAVLRNFLTIVH